METFLIPRRFVRIKALQNLYAYTIAQIAHKKEAVEQVKNDFVFDPFLDALDEKAQRATEQSIAVELCSKAVAAGLPTEAFAYVENKKIEQSVRGHLCHYLAALQKEQALLQGGFSQSKESIYIGLLYVLLLLVEWYKLAKQSHDPCKPTDHLLNSQLAEDPLLRELHDNRSWINAIYKNGISWAKDQDQVKSWFRQFIQAAEIPKWYRSGPDNGVKLLEYILEKIIFQEGPINDFLAMADLYWDEHKRLVKKLLTRVFMLLLTKDFTTFTLLWHHLEEKWTTEAAFYNRLLTIVLENNPLYEAMIGEKAEKWDHERILLTDKLILKLALAELLECQEIPLKVSINEYIEIAKWYGTSKSGSFINGVLEGILKGLEDKR
ncbi:transcription antitermination factor NusB [Cardinium endosymbiont of Philonthus spinipes]|uniref:transcription antitermination factor NusB n=1 Tax=Cardinium endosymbiont of Philonthus spinipes TaxID=3077941 RepID=UPI00313E5B66